MADNVLVDNGDGTDYTVSSDEASSGQVQRTKLAYSANGSDTHVQADADGLLVNLGANNDVTVTGTVAVTQSGTWDEIGINDSGNSITVDDGGSTLSIDDGGGTITVDGTVGVSGTVTVDSELTTSDLDTGAGTDTRAVVGLVGSKSGGGALIPGDATAGLKVDLGADNDVTVTGSVTANAGTNLNTSSLALETGGNLAASATSLALIDDVIVADDAAFTPATTKVAMAGFTFDDVAPDSVNEGDGGAARMSANRNIYTTIRDAAGNERGANVNASSQLSVSVDNTVTVGSHAVTNAGTFATQVDGAALTSLQLIDDPVIADDAAFTPATSKVMMAGYQADESSTDSVDEGDAGAARMTLDRKVIVNNQPHSAGGCSIYRSIDLDEGTLEVIKNSPGTVYGMWVTNTATSTRFIKFYDATSGTAGTGTPVITIGIPGNTSDDVAGAFGPGGVGIAFATGICFGATTGVADADTGAPSANDVIANVFYK